MKFGRKISTDLYNEWRPFYLNYNLLKRELKDRTLGRSWNARDEREFTAMLEKELDKIHDFQKAKVRHASYACEFFLRAPLTHPDLGAVTSHP
jgi:SPX domain protein involved in polyphosphate accumulation